MRAPSLNRTWRSGSLADRIELVVYAVAVLITGAVVLVSLLNRGSSADVSETPTPPPVVEATRSGTKPVLLEEVAARVLRGRLVSKSSLQLRVRVRNQTARAQAINENGRQLYLILRRGRLLSAPTHALRAAPNSSVTFTASFDLTRRRLQAVRASGVLKLAVVPFSELPFPTPSRIGVIRLPTKLVAALSR